MRLLQLHMQNFGPYRDEHVDFEAFDTTPLFLISGKTGAGKTTIFDALVFALYGTTTGGERSGNEMRANFATPEEPTKVTLSFTHGGRKYLITRAPEQLLAKKRGEGLTNVAAKVSLKIFVDDAEVDELTKVQTVRTRIDSLLQLDANQFRQMVLLPQGKFRQFLDANSDAKADLLRHLFDTDLYLRWQTSIQTAAKKQSRALDVKQAQLETLSSQFDYGDHQPDDQATLADKITLMQAQLADQTAAVASLQTHFDATKAAYDQANLAYQSGSTLAQAFTHLHQANSALAQLDQQATHLASQTKRLEDLQWAHEWQPVAEQITNGQESRQQLLTQVAQANAEQTKAQHALTQAQAQQLALQAQAPAIKAAQNELTQLADTKHQLQQLADLRQSQTKAQTLHQQLSQTAAAALTAYQALLTQQAANQEAQADLAKSDQTQALADLEKLTAGLSATARTWQQSRQRVAEVQAKLTDAQTQVQQAQVEAAAANDHYQVLHDQSLTNQIAALVGQLSANAPCPVCGSLDHPHPATAQAGQTVTPAALKQADTKRMAASATLAQAEALTARLDQQLKQLTQDIQDSAQVIQSQAGELAQADAETTLNVLRQQLIDLRFAQQQWVTQSQNLRQQAEQLAAQVQAAQHKVDDTKAQVQQQALELAGIKAQVQAAQQALKTPELNLEAVVAKQNALKQQLSVYEQATADNAEALQQANQALTRLTTSIADRNAQLESVQTTLNAAQSKLDAAMQAHGQCDAQTFAQLLAASDEIPELQQQISAAKTKRAQQLALKASAETQIGDQPEPDLPALTTARHDAELANTQAAQQTAAAQHALTQAQALVTTIQQEYHDNQAALSENIALQNLAAVVNGNNAQRLSLERYVLRTYLQQVLVVANKRLEGLSDGRYQLTLHQEPGSYKNDSGLEIDVYDDQVGETRSVHTLSGGESFIAALALALALGEVIQEQAGGVSIDALFIDEGFGSLDQSSLDTALEALESIEGQSRMIGIISHVESLQTGIPDQLRVTPTGAGDSHIDVVHLGK